MTGSTFSITERMRSFGYAFQGLGFMLRTQHNAWIHVLASLMVIILAAVLDVAAEAWVWLIVAMALVWIAETTNTAFEHVCDVISPEFHPAVKRAKDVAAGAVLLSAVAAVAIGAITLWPYVRTVF